MAPPVSDPATAKAGFPWWAGLLLGAGLIGGAYVMKKKKRSRR
jgi:LPXTG-motif cell wall-anchored protein